MYTVSQTNNPNKVKAFNTLEDAQEFVKRQRKAKGFYTITEEKPVKQTENKSWKNNVEFHNEVEITRKNVKDFYKKEGYIKIVDLNGNIVHVGRTKNMGKVFSNYVNCANYNQSYNFNIESGEHRLFFMEANTHQL